MEPGGRTALAKILPIIVLHKRSPQPHHQQQPQGRVVAVPEISVQLRGVVLRIPAMPLLISASHQQRGATQCTRIPGSYVSANGGDITIQQDGLICNNACPDGSDAPYLFASKFHCDGIGLAHGCQDNGQNIGSNYKVGDVIPVPAPSCGTIQVDLGCKNSANTWGNLVFSTRAAATACNTATTPPGSPTAPPTAPSCIAVKAYDDAWAALTTTQLSALTAGDTVNFCVSGNAASGTFDKAQFMVNTTLEPETTTKRPSSGDFCQAYTILSTDTTVGVKAKIHSSTGVWVGESI